MSISADQQHTFALEFLNALPIKRGTVLDIGAGPGFQTQWFIEHGFDAVAVDVVKPRVDVPFLLADVGNVAIALDRPVDAVWSHHMLEHVENPLRVLREFHRIIKPDGWLFLTVPQFNDTISSGHIVSYTMPLLIYHLALVGFDMRTSYYGKFRSHLRMAARKHPDGPLAGARSLAELARAHRLPMDATVAANMSGRFDSSHCRDRWFPR